MTMTLATSRPHFAAPYETETVVVGAPDQIPIESNTVGLAIFRVDQPRPRTPNPANEITSVITEATRILEPGGRLAVVTPPSVRRSPWVSLAATVAEAMEQAGVTMLSETVWIKHPVPSQTLIQPNVRTFFSPHSPPVDVVSERILVAAKQSPARVPDPVTRRRQGLPYETDIDEVSWQRDTLDVWFAPSDDLSCEVPADVYARIITLHTYRQDLVVDMKCQTGIALHTALHLDRHALGVDNDHANVTQARDRIAALTP